VGGVTMSGMALSAWGRTAGRGIRKAR